MRSNKALRSKKGSKNKIIEQDFQSFDNIVAQLNMGSIIIFAEPCGCYKCVLQIFFYFRMACNGL